MIIFNPGQVDGGKFIMHMHIEFNHNRGLYQFVRSEIVNSQAELNKLQSRWLSHWFRTEIRSYIKQREHALAHVNMLHLGNLQAIEIIAKNVVPEKKLLPMCKAIILHQVQLRQLLPGPDSRQSSWIRVIEEIIHAAHDYIHKQHIRSISRSAEQPNTPRTQMAH